PYIRFSPPIFLPFVLSFFNVPPLTTIFPLSLHDALPIYARDTLAPLLAQPCRQKLEPHLQPSILVDLFVHCLVSESHGHFLMARSEEHTSELQSRFDLVCRLLLEKKKNARVILSTYNNRY